jgi:hypothetical protein
MANEYVARVSTKAGRNMHTTGAHPSREEAAKAAFSAKPNALKVSTSIAHNGGESHRDIRWHDHDEIVKKPIKEGRVLSKSVREGIAYLIEDAYEKSTVVMAAEEIGDKLLDMAEQLSTIEAKDIMPLQDGLSTAFSPQVANQFNGVATEKIRQLITAIQDAKTAIEAEVNRMKQGVEGGDMTDMGNDVGDMNVVGDDGTGEGNVDPQGLEAPPGAPVAPAEGLPEVPVGGDEGIGGGFAGRARKESARPRGKSLGEDFLGNTPAGRSPPAIDRHPHKSVDFAPNMSNLAHFHGSAGKMARNIENMIDTDPLTGQERTGLANCLSHFAAFASEPAHWSDAEAKLTMCLQAANLWDTSKPAVAKIVVQLRKLAHLIAFKHEGMIESAIQELKTSADPDSLILKTFRTKLSETRDAQTAAIGTARTYAIDIEDVVMIVREAAQDRDRYGATAMMEAKKAQCEKCHGSGKVYPKHAKDGGGTTCPECKGSGKAPVREAAKKKGGFPKTDDVFNKHQKAIALKTLKMNDAGASVMGGMTKAEARVFLKDKCGYSDEQIKKLDEALGLPWKKKKPETEKARTPNWIDNPTGNTYSYSGKVNPNANVKPDQWTKKWQMPIGEEAEEPKTDKPKWQKPWEKKADDGPKEEVSEDDQTPVADDGTMIQNGTMFPVQTAPNAMATPDPSISNPGPSGTSTTPVGGPNNNPSTRPAMTPGDMRVRQQQQNASQQTTTMNQPNNGQAMTPPTENGATVNGSVPSSTQPRKAPTNTTGNVKPFRFQRQQQ